MSDETDKSRPPLVENVLADVLKRHRNRGRHWPEMMPKEIHQAVCWWMDLVEPPAIPQDNPEPVKTDKGIIGWRTPYHDRLKNWLLKFLSFNQAQQVWIVEHIKRGIPWFGDDGKFYAVIIKQHETMNKNPAEYVGKAAVVLQAFRETY